MEFPKIDYRFWFNEWNNDVGQDKTYSNINMLEYIKFDGDINLCTNEIENLVKSKNLDKVAVLRVIDLIYSWGGTSGRMFYASQNGKISPRKNLEVDQYEYSKYISGVNLAKVGNHECVKVFCKIKGIGPSYASKHTYFWSMNSEHPLIIIDSKIAGALGYKTINDLEKYYSYEEVIKHFVCKSVEEFSENKPSKIEKALFAFHNHYFLNNNNGWKNEIKFQDYSAATKLAEILFQ